MISETPTIFGVFDPKMTKNGGWGPPLTKPIALRRDLPGYLVSGGKGKSGVFWPPPKNDQKWVKMGSFPTWPILLKNGHFWNRFWNWFNKFIKLFFIRVCKKNFNTYRKKFSSFGKKISKVVINFLDNVASYRFAKN